MTEKLESLDTATDIDKELPPVDDEKAITPAEIVSPWVPFSVTSFDELDAAQDAKATGQQLSEMADQFQSIVRNILEDSETDDKAVAIGALASEFAQRVADAMTAKEIEETDTKAVKDANIHFDVSEEKVAEGVISWLKNKLGIKSADLINVPDGAKEQPFMVWKEADGTYRWFAIYSNNYRDDDNPPEILSKAAHVEFINAVDKGEWPHPELWLWHVPGTKCGKCDWLAFDEDSGFALSSGTFDEDKESVAESLAEYDEPLLTSHGMPSEETEREDKEDQTILTRYRSIEISPLPAWAAANKDTPFVVLDKEASMTIPDEKREFLDGLGLDASAIEAELQERKDALDTAGVENKDAETAEELVEETTETVTEPVEPIDAEPAEETETAPATENAFTEAQTKQLADAFEMAMQPLMQRIDVLEEKTVEPDPEPEPVEEKSALPSDWLGELLHSRVIGNQATQVDGRTKEGKDGPEETGTPAPTVLDSGDPLGDSIINRLVSGQTFKELDELRQNA